MDTEFISLGGNCAIAYQLQKLGLRNNSYPFDWATSTLNQVKTAFEDNLTRYALTLDIYKFSSNHEYINIKDGNITFEKDKGTYKCKNIYNITIAHILTKISGLEELEEFKTKMEKRKNKFINLDKINKNITFIRLETKIISSELYLDNLIIISKKLLQFNKKDKPDSQLDKPDSQLDKPDSQLDKPDSQLDNPDSQLDNPDSQLDKPDSQLDKPDSQLDKPDSQLDNPDSQLDNPDSQLDKPDSQLDNPDSQLDKPDSQLDNPDSQLDKPDSQLDNKVITLKIILHSKNQNIVDYYKKINLIKNNINIKFYFYDTFSSDWTFPNIKWDTILC